MPQWRDPCSSQAPPWMAAAPQQQHPGYLRVMACHQKAFQPTIPDSQGQVSSNKLCYMVSFIIGMVIVTYHRLKAELFIITH